MNKYITKGVEVVKKEKKSILLVAVTAAVTAIVTTLICGRPRG